MKTISAKKQARLEKKKKKSAALAQIVKLNDEDVCVVKKSNHRLSESNNGTAKNKKDNLNVKSKNNKVNVEETTEKNSLNDFEPKKKKMKLELSSSSTSSSSPSLSSSLENSNTNYKKTKTEKANKIDAVNNEIAENSNKTDSNEIEYMSEREAKQRQELRLGRDPRIRLKEFGELALLSTPDESRTPIFLTDIQHLIMSTLIGNLKSPFMPSRWFHLEKESKLTHSVVLIIEGISLFHFLSYESKFQECNRIFNHKLEVIMPPYKEGCIIEELASIPIATNQREALIEKYGSLEAAFEVMKDTSLLMRTLFSIDKVTSKEIPEVSDTTSTLAATPATNQKQSKLSRTKLLLSALQMVEEQYPLPLNGALANKYKNYVFTKDKYSPVNENSPMFGVDCEMCRTITGTHELTRISIVDEDLKPVYETLVRPTNKIVDYLTLYSGITPEMMLNVTKTLEEVQNEIRKILPSDAILIGQSLNCDLHAMKMMHPYVIDTSVIFNMTGYRRKKSKLQTLAKKFLGENIQLHGDGHDSLEDSRASMKLTQLKLANGINFGDEVLQGRQKANTIEMNIKQASQSQTETDNLLLNNNIKNEKRVAIVCTKEYEFSSILQNIEHKNVNEIDSDKNTNVNKVNSSVNENIHYYKIEGNKSAIRKTQALISEDYYLTITNLNISAQRLELSRIDKTIANIDKWVNRLWESVKHRGHFMVIFGGAEDSSNGIAMIKIKKIVSDKSTNET